MQHERGEATQKAADNFDGKGEGKSPALDTQLDRDVLTGRRAWKDAYPYG